MSDTPEHNYVSRGGLKLEAALDAFALDVTGFVCADLGCNVGGFTDCLLQRGAAQVYAVDTGYGQLAWKLRQDERVVVMERTNAMHVEIPEQCVKPQAAVDLVVLDMGWTKQQHAVPAALRWGPKLIVTLIKPHYEASGQTKGQGKLDEAEAQRVCEEVLCAMPELGVEVLGCIRSPIVGGAGKGRRGNTEYLAHLRVPH